MFVLDYATFRPSQGVGDQQRYGRFEFNESFISVTFIYSFEPRKKVLEHQALYEPFIG
jgi:hypothetical protein